MSGTLQLRIGHGTVRAEVARRGKRVWAGEATFAEPIQLGEAIAGLAGESTLPAKTLRLRVVLELPVVQVRLLHDLPPVRATDLRILVANQSGRFFRKNGKPLVTDAVWMRRDRKASAGWVAVAAAVEEPWLDAITAGAAAAGLRLETIGPAAELTSARLELFSPSEQGRRRTRDRLALRRLTLFAAALWLLAVGLVGLRVRQDRQRIERELAELQAPAAALLELRREVGEAARMIETIDRAGRERDRVLSGVIAIAVALPDSAYLTSLTLDREGRGSMTGAALQAAQVVAALDRDGAAIEPRLTGPAVRELIAGRERERFSVTFGPARVR